jgi:alkylated DNA repair dioxygenase AlkB
MSVNRSDGARAPVPRATTQTFTDVPGLELRPNYVDTGGQERLLAIVDALPWQADLRRRVQHYGYRYDYRSRSAGRDAYLGPLPGWAADLAGRLTADTPVERTPDQVIVNEYLPGQGISAHVDCVPCFGNVVLSISLGSMCVMTFSEPETGSSIDVLVEPGALMVMSGDARYVWRHSIAARRSDVVGDRRVERDRRVSLTFRTVLLDDRA